MAPNSVSRYGNRSLATSPRVQSLTPVVESRPTRIHRKRGVGIRRTSAHLETRALTRVSASTAAARRFPFGRCSSATSAVSGGSPHRVCCWRLASPLKYVVAPTDRTRTVRVRPIRFCPPRFCGSNPIREILPLKSGRLHNEAVVFTGNPVCSVHEVSPVGPTFRLIPSARPNFTGNTVWD